MNVRKSEKTVEERSELIGKKKLLWLFRTNDKGTQCKKMKTGTNLQDFRKFSSHCYTDILRR